LRHSSSSNLICLPDQKDAAYKTQEITCAHHQTRITAQGSPIELRVGHEQDRYKKEVPGVPAITCAHHQTEKRSLVCLLLLVLLLPWRLASGVSWVSSSSAQSPEHGGRSSFGCRRSTSSGPGGRCSSPAQTATTTTGIRQERALLFSFSFSFSFSIERASLLVATRI
jgi:hypothetical protein